MWIPPHLLRMIKQFYTNLKVAVVTDRGDVELHIALTGITYSSQLTFSSKGPLLLRYAATVSFDAMPK